MPTSDVSPTSHADFGAATHPGVGGGTHRRRATFDLGSLLSQRGEWSLVRSFVCLRGGFDTVVCVLCVVVLVAYLRVAPVSLLLRVLVTVHRS